MTILIAIAIGALAFIAGWVAVVGEEKHLGDMTGLIVGACVGVAAVLGSLL